MVLGLDDPLSDQALGGGHHRLRSRARLESEQRPGLADVALPADAEIEDDAADHGIEPVARSA